MKHSDFQRIISGLVVTYSLSMLGFQAIDYKLSEGYLVLGIAFTTALVSALVTSLIKFKD